MNVFTCENNLEAILTCIYDAWASKLGHRNLRLMLEPVRELELFCDYIHTEPDSEKVSKVIRSIRKRSPRKPGRSMNSRAMSCDPVKAGYHLSFSSLRLCLRKARAGDAAGTCCDGIFRA